MDLALVFLRCLFIFFSVHLCGTAIFLAGDAYLKGEMTVQILVDALLGEDKVCVRGVATKGKESVVLYFVIYPPSPAPNTVCCCCCCLFFLGGGVMWDVLPLAVTQ